MNGKTIGIIIAVIVLAGSWYLFSRAPVSAPVTPAAPQGKPATTAAPATSPSGVIVAYTNQGFSPKSITVPLGTTVTFVNQSSDSMWVASGPHPTHQGYDGTTGSEHCAAGYAGPKAFDECSTGKNYDFTFLKTGTWKYHNHLDAADTGTIIVTAATSI